MTLQLIDGSPPLKTNDIISVIVLKKTPSKMDVAPWEKHWIKRESDGFGLYSMVFVEIQWCSIVFVEIQWYSMVFVEIQ